MKYPASFFTLCSLVLLCPTFADAQIGRRGRTSERIAIPVEVPPPAPDFDPSNVIGVGAVVSCEDPTRPLSDETAPAAVVYRGTEVDTKAVIAETAEPAYTEEARVYGTSGLVALRVTLAAEGQVSEVKVLRALPDGLTESAIDAACRIKFTPARKGGQTVSQYVTVEFNFETDDFRLPPPGSRRPVGVPPPGSRRPVGVPPLGVPTRRVPPTFPYTPYEQPLSYTPFSFSRPWTGWGWFPFGRGCPR